MKALVYRCPKCYNTWNKSVEDDSTNDYTEEFVWKKCPKCKVLPETAEEKLLAAIFGERR